MPLHSIEKTVKVSPDSILRMTRCMFHYCLAAAKLIRSSNICMGNIINTWGNLYWLFANRNSRCSLSSSKSSIPTLMFRIMFCITRLTLIMYQHFRVADIISMEICNLKVICRLWAFQQFMLNLLNNDTLPIEHNENIARSEVDSRSPTLNGRVERMFIRADNLLSVYFDVYKLTRFIDKCSDYFFKPGFPGFRVGCPYHIPDLDRFNSNMSGSSRYLSAFYKTNAD